MVDKKNCLGEVIGSSIKSWSGVCWQWDVVPQFGQLLAVSSGNVQILGVVSDIQTGSIDAGRVPFAYQKTEEELMREQPQIFEFLRTTFTCLIVGYREGNKNIHSFAQKPPQIHSFIGVPGYEIAREFSDGFGYVKFLMEGEGNPLEIDELLLAHVRYGVRESIFDGAALAAHLCQLGCLSGDYHRKRRLLAALEELL
jgi:hypothetical protein